MGIMDNIRHRLVGPLLTLAVIVMVCLMLMLVPAIMEGNIRNILIILGILSFEFIRYRHFKNNNN